MLTIRLPYTTPPLTLNQRLHWAAKHRETARIRHDVGALARAALERRHTPMTRAHVDLWWTPKDARRRDTDNPAPTLKACIDGLRDAGVFLDDDSATVSSRVVIGPPDKADPRMELIVHEWLGEWT